MNEKVMRRVTRRQEELKIVGQLRATFDELHSMGCIQTGADVYPILAEAQDKFGIWFYQLGLLTCGNLCDGCPQAGAIDYVSRPTKIEDVKCKAFHRFHSMATDRQREKAQAANQATKAPGTDRYPGMSVKQIAEKLGISKNEVRRRKRDGLL